MGLMEEFEARAEEAQEELQAAESPEGAEEASEGGQETEGAEGKSLVLDGEGLPEELRGKTPEEVGQIFRELSSTARGLAARMQQQGAQPVQEQTEVPDFSTDDFVSEDGGFRQKLDQYFQAKAQPLVQQLQQARASQAWFAAREHYPMLKKHEKEALGYLQSATPEQLTDPGTYAVVNAQLMQDHQHELVEEEIKRRSKPSPPASARAGNQGEGEKSRRLTPAEKAVARAIGVSEEDYLKHK